MQRLKLGFIGAGNMGGAIIKGILSQGIMNAGEIGVCLKNRLKTSDIAVFDKDDEKLRFYREAGHPVFNSVGELTAACEKIVLSVKPQNFTEIMPEVAGAMTPEKLIISIAAGISAKSIKDAIGFDCKVVLVMPNTPMLVGEGASALARVEPATEEEFREVMELFESAGVAGEVGPDKMCDVIPVNGSSPAFIYQFAKDIMENAEHHGIDGNTAMKLFCQTLVGSAKMLMQSGKTPQELIDMVCSPGGTTIAAMEALRQNGFSEAVTAAFDACVKRGRELSGE